VGISWLKFVRHILLLQSALRSKTCNEGSIRDATRLLAKDNDTPRQAVIDANNAWFHGVFFNRMTKLIEHILCVNNVYLLGDVVRVVGNGVVDNIIIAH
jgi:hypothetical protein